MAEDSTQTTPYRAYRVWDAHTRWFHWINVICVLGLVVFGLAILNHKALGIDGAEEVLLKRLHVFTGYAFVLNLAWRLVRAFTGGRYSRWRALLPCGRGYVTALRDYVAGLRRGHAPAYLGHNPAGRLMVSLLLLLLCAQAVTGLVLAGTDLYYPPFGARMERWVAAEPDGPALRPGSREGVDAQRYAQMRDFRKPFITVHYYAFYLLLIAAALHIIAVVVGEAAEKSGLVSAMFSGRKYFSTKPVDADD